VGQTELEGQADGVREDGGVLGVGSVLGDSGEFA